MNRAIVLTKDEAMPNRLWVFLKSEDNQKLLGWIGGGLALIAGGLWAVFVYFFPAPQTKPNPPQKHIEADCGSVAIGGDVSGTSITAGNSGDCPKPRP
ncbi:hypothetical protein CU048_09675 [Beijerinckiaceae bacterium]|nr:hypothetical protein CU048_09675 [Beijerinckiaceae bacterium]